MISSRRSYAGIAFGSRGGAAIGSKGDAMRGILKTLVPLALLPSAALAHSGHAETSGLISGLLHPLTGTDHLLAMVAVGIIAALSGARMAWALPAGFLAALIAGAGFGFVGVELPAIEALILGSVIAFGLVVLLPARLLSHRLILAVTAIFGAAHGFAHGIEAPASGSIGAYGAGFVIMTAMLLATGSYLGRKLPTTAIRSGGVAILLAGLGLILAA